MSSEGQDNDAEQQDEGLIKKPMKGSFKRVGDRMTEEMSEKTPTQALEDDLSGSGGPTQEEKEHLDRKVKEAEEATSSRPGSKQPDSGS